MSKRRRTSDIVNTSTDAGSNRIFQDLAYRYRLPFAVSGVAIVALIALGWALPNRQIMKAKEAILCNRFEEAEDRLKDYPWWGMSLGQTMFLRARIARIEFDVESVHLFLGNAQLADYDRDAIVRERQLLFIQLEGAAQLRGRLNEFVRKDPADAAAVFQAFALGYLRSGNVAAAIEVLEAWSVFDPHDARSHYHKGTIYQLQEKANLALSEFQQATRLNPALIDADLGQAAIYESREQYADALSHYRAVTDQCPRLLMPKVKTVEILWEMNRRLEAVEEAERIAASDPSIFLPGHMLGEYFTATQQPTKVVQYLEPMMQFFPENADLNCWLGAAYWELGRRDDSNKALEKFVAANQRLDGLRHEVVEQGVQRSYEDLLRIADQTRAYEWFNALTWLNHAVDLRPDLPDAYERISLYLSESGDAVEAAKQLRIAHRLQKMAH